MDELYAALVISPLQGISEFILWKGTDEGLVDRHLVHGWSRASLLGARVVTKMQSGLLEHYLFFLWLGLAGVLLIILR
jgi:NADH:ubiquinone oxidoreductase subunit 5 (subunit L)/multisubunit Na+/H+ antiporter MnhA subunit